MDRRRAVQMDFAITRPVAACMEVLSGANAKAPRLSAPLNRAEQLFGDTSARFEFRRYGWNDWRVLRRLHQRWQGHGVAMPKSLRVETDETKPFQVLARFVNGQPVAVGDVFLHGAERGVVMLRCVARDAEDNFQAGVRWTPKGGDNVRVVFGFGKSRFNRGASQVVEIGAKQAGIVFEMGVAALLECSGEHDAGQLLFQRIHGLLCSLGIARGGERLSVKTADSFNVFLPAA